MLVLTRKTKQQIKIGNDVVITILQVRGQTVRVGIEAPRETRVVRAEIADLPHDNAEQVTVAASADERPVGRTVAERLVSEAVSHAPRTTADYRASGWADDANRNPLGRLSPNIRPASSSANSPPCETSCW
jgi:carbon storage regulator